MCLAGPRAKGRNLDQLQKESDKPKTALVKLQWEKHPPKAACNIVRLNLVFLVPCYLLTEQHSRKDVQAEIYELKCTLDDKRGWLAPHLTSALINIQL